SPPLSSTTTGSYSISIRPSAGRPGTAKFCNCEPYTGSGTKGNSPEASRRRCSSVLGGTARRNNNATASERSIGSKPGTVPRPSLVWQAWQDRALNNGPRPSDAWVDDGEDTQSLRNRPLPTRNCWRPSNVRLAEGCEKMSALISLRVVAAPADMASNCSA